MLPFIILLLAIILATAKSAIESNSRVDCAPKYGEGKSECLARKCIWDNNYDQFHPSVPLCYFPPDTGYSVVSQSPIRTILKRLPGGAKNPYGADFDRLEFKVAKLSSAMHISIGANGRFRPMVPLNSEAQLGLETDALKVKIHSRGNGSSTADKFFYFTVQRESDRTTIWDTSIGGLLFADQFVQIAAYLPTNVIYGFGENAHRQFKHDLSKYTTWGMYSRDQAPNVFSPNNEDLYGVHPFYMGLEPDGKAHGVYFFNANPQEVTTGPAPHLIYRTIGGQLDMFFLPGPTPELVVQQYQQLVGLPYLPPYWALGYQFCRFGYKDLDDLKATIGRIRKAQIPLDVVFVDIDHMDRYKDFTVDPKKWAGLGEYVEQLHRDGLKFVPIIDPAIQVDYEVFQRGLQAGASFVEWERFDQVPKAIQNMYPMAKDTKIMLGIVWPDHHVAFPDFLDPENKTQNWWANELKIFHEKVHFDGIWIDMNEPSNFNTNEKPSQASHNLQPLSCPTTGPDAHFDKPPYETISVYQYGAKSLLSEKTLCLLGKTARGTHRLYNTHNLYGWSEMVATRKGLDELFGGKRSQLLTRSSFVGTGHLGTHWTGDNSARWPDLRSSVIGLLEFNIFGIPHIGADVCGFNLNTTEELCLRWQQLGAFYPFFRNHNSEGEIAQDPPQWESVANASRVANQFRYQLLPYLYSLHFRASKYGGTVVRPLFFEFPDDLTLYDQSRQFLWGPSVMVVPVLDPGVDSVRAYFPEKSTWYSISNAHKYGSRIESGGFHQVKAPKDTPLPTFLRGGAIIPEQKAETTTEKSRKNPIRLKIGLAPTTLEANGELFWDDGETIVCDFDSHPHYHFEFAMKMGENVSQLVMANRHCPTPAGKQVEIPPLDSIEVLGYPRKPDFRRCSLNDKSLSNFRFGYNARKERLLIDFGPQMVNLAKLEKGQEWTLKWHHEPPVEVGKMMPADGRVPGWVLV